jgi:hypothetical protein
MPQCVLGSGEEQPIFRMLVLAHQTLLQTGSNSPIGAVGVMASHTFRVPSSSVSVAIPSRAFSDSDEDVAGFRESMSLKAAVANAATRLRQSPGLADRLDGKRESFVSTTERILSGSPELIESADLRCVTNQTTIPSLFVWAFPRTVCEPVGYDGSWKKVILLLYGGSLT